MNYETNRLNTFTNWPASAPVDPIRIAKAGFFYTGQGTEVQCFSCAGKISQWGYGDQVMWRHRILEPNCAFVVNPQLSGNVALVLGQGCPSVNNVTTESIPDEGPNESVDTNPDYGRTEEDEMYQSDALRLLSFINWDDTSVCRESLVSAGFYHAGEGRLRCAWCGGELAPFTRLGSIGHPLEIHRIYFPRCEHAARLHAARLPSSVSLPTTPPAQTPPPVQTAPPTTESIAQSSGAAQNERLLRSGGSWRSLGVVGGVARHPEYAPIAARLQTYRRWPADRQQAPRTLAEAGFYHTGTDDQVRCFYCDGGLGMWEAGDTPWTEHAHWFPHCGFVLLVKGQEFVDSCRDRTSSHRPVANVTGGDGTGRRNPNLYLSPPETEVQAHMESGPSLAALGAGLDAARVRRAIARRLGATGRPFASSDALIHAVMDVQLNEEAWSSTPYTQQIAREMLTDAMYGIPPITRHWIDRTNIDHSDSPHRDHLLDSDTRSPSPHSADAPQEPQIPTEDIVPSSANQPHEEDEIPSVASTESRRASESDTEEELSVGQNKLSLEEENRQLKEAKLCKVCMDCDVSVVFLPCGHLVSCARCGAALAACPLCRATVRALVRAYLA